MTVIDETKARSAQVEAWLDEWAIYVRGRVDLGYPHASPETKAVFGGRAKSDAWPAEVEAVESCMRHMPEKSRQAPGWDTWGDQAPNSIIFPNSKRAA